MGYFLWVASNLAAPYARPLRTLLEGLVDGYFLSFEMGSIKPEPDFFHQICTRLEMSPGCVVMVGNSVHADVEGAERVGMRSIYLNRGTLGLRPGAIHSLRELVGRAENGWN